MTSTISLKRRLHARVLASGTGFEVVDTQWHRDHHPIESEDCTSYAAIEFMRSGCFRKRVRGFEIVGDPNTAIFFNPGEPFSIHHPQGHDNAGTTIRLDESLVHEALSEQGSVPPNWSNGLFPRTHMTTTGRVHLLQQRLVSLLSESTDVDGLEVEERVLQIVDQLVAPNSATDETTGACHSPGRPVIARRVADVLEYLNSAYSQRIALKSLASMAGCSSWHLSRCFTYQLGLPVHRYLTRLRLRRALERLADGVHDLTGLAMETGFNSHSHFTASFHREFGITPRQCRLSLSGGVNPRRIKTK